MSVYDRMYNDERLFWLGYGVLYITEMKRVKGLNNTGLRIKSRGIAEKWFRLFEKYGVLSRKNRGLHEYNGIFSFGGTVQSLYHLLTVVGKIPDREMDTGVRKRISKIVYSGADGINSTRIKILKTLKTGSLTTNELARRVEFCSGNVFKKHLISLSKSNLVKRQAIGKQRVLNILTPEGARFIIDFENKIETAPTESLYDNCFTDKQLAADLFMVACELEMGGILERQPYLQMISKDFVEFSRSVAKKWGWTHYDHIVEINRPGWSTSYLVGFNSKAVKEIYPLSGPCADAHKDACFKQALSLRAPGRHRKMGETRNDILRLIEKNICTAKEIALNLNIGIQNIQKALTDLVNSGRLKREWKNRGYYYSKMPVIADANHNIP